ncbi:hypothetical protein [Bradyrhizobium sp.]|uniref:hypothetical protein n=1 Tax=Bradyrhizobium sp. TaxID=376 RepID=UPI0025B91AE8|nr:hypothetical protein [Bradyrhizobium sp.]
MVQSTIGRVLTDMEREIQAEVRNRPHESRAIDFAPPMARAPTLAMPDYVEHRDGATEIGKLSAEAVVREYEAAAKDIEALGVELVSHVRQCEAMTRDALAVTEELKETAERYREEAKRVFLQIENCSQMTVEVRKICTDLRDRISIPANMASIENSPKVKTKKLRLET